jgi:RNA polymerase sigma-70 factor, ECF subfamily
MRDAGLMPDPGGSARHRTDDVSRLVAAARAGDRRAFDQLYVRYRPLVYGVVLGSVRGPAVEDLVQDVFLQAWRKLSALHTPDAFGGWLTTIARRTAVDHLRHRPFVDEPLTDIAAAHDATDASDALAAREALHALESLPVPYRDTLRLRLVDGLTGPEIAVRTGLTPASVRVNLCRGMKLLRARLQGRTSNG